jgi:hypothetical protein
VVRHFCKTPGTFAAIAPVHLFSAHGSSVRPVTLSLQALLRMSIMMTASCWYTLLHLIYHLMLMLMCVCCLCAVCVLSLTCRHR